MKQIVIAVVFLATIASHAYAEFSLPHFFSDHMVLQRERPAAIWGISEPGSDVSVSFKGQIAATKADSSGHWKVEIETGPADATGATLTISSNDKRLALNDVLVGEVWFASGQSNMAFTMNRVPGYAAVIRAANHPLIRMFNAPTVTAVEPQEDIDGRWTLCTPQTAGEYSAVAFFFARKLHTELDVPIGVIKSAWGGKPVETFTSRTALSTLTGTKELVDAVLQADAAFDAAKAKIAYAAQLDQWQAAQQDTKKRKANAKKPTAPKRPLDTEGKPGVLFNSMINPFVGYTMRGAIWYQGEANAKPGAVPYDQTLPLMIADWRARWKNEFSFYYVQLANFRQPSTEPGTPDAWALLQDRMRLILDTTPKTGMAIINDVGEAADIHPKDKQAPGERLALWALAKDYGRDIVYSGPFYASSRIDGDAVVVSFEQAGQGLRSRNGESLKRFEIAGADKVWHWAEASIDSSSSVRVHSPEVKSPVAVRYAWAANPEGANLVNSEGLPASVFRTDNWDDVHDPAPARAAIRR